MRQAPALVLATLLASTAHGGTIRVPLDAPTIQDGIGMALDGDVILVAPGTWSERIDLGGRAIAVRSEGDASNTTIDGGGIGPVVEVLDAPGAFIEGFTIVGGDAGSGTGGGIRVVGSTLEVRGCVLVGNRAAQGASLWAEDATVDVISCTFRDHPFAFGGTLAALDATLRIEGCTWRDNQTGVVATSCDTTILGGTFLRNRRAIGPGGAVAISGGTLDVQGGDYASNRAGSSGGAIAVTNGVATIADAQFSLNDLGPSGTSGGAVMLIGGGPHAIDGCAFLDNAAPARGGAVATLGPDATITDCLFDGNAATSADGAGGAVHLRRQQSPATISVSDCTFVGNAAARGGALRARDGATVHVTGGSFTGDAATIAGGAIDVAGSGTILTATGTTIVAATSLDRGGALFAGVGTTATLTTCTIEGGQATRGGCVAAEGATVALVACTLSIGPVAPDEGGAIHGIDADLLLDGGTITATAALGGAAHLAGGSLVATGTAFLSCTAAGSGGGIDATDAAIELDATTFEVCLAGDDGGAVRLVGGSLATTGGAMNGCAAADGGAIALGPGGTATLDAPTISGAFATTGDGGAIAILDAEVTIVGGSILGCGAETRGGAIALRATTPDAATATLEETTIDGASARIGGGCSVAGPARLSLIESTIRRGKATDRGGGIATEGGGGWVVLSGAAIEHNAARSGGGLSLAAGDLATLIGGAVRRNAAIESGGGLDVAGQLTANGTLLRANEAGAAGGAARIIGVAAFGRFEVLSISANRATDGGGLASDHAGLVASDCTFDGNRASESVGSGGAILVRTEGSLVARVERCTITGSRAARGGAIALRRLGVGPEAASLRIDRTRLVANRATETGGAVDVRSATGGPLSLLAVNSLFIGNASFGSAGGIAIDGSGATARIVNATFAEHLALVGPSVVTATGGAAAAFENSIASGYDGLPFGGATSVAFSLVQGGWAGIGNRSGDPRYVAPALGDYRLDAGSPAIDAGRNAALPIFAIVDLDGIDRYVEDPDAPNVGEGTGPIVDIGAHERMPFAAEPSAPEDLDGDGDVDAADVQRVLAAWGTAPGDPADLDEDGFVGWSDLRRVIRASGR